MPPPEGFLIAGRPTRIQSLTGGGPTIRPVGWGPGAAEGEEEHKARFKEQVRAVARGTGGVRPPSFVFALLCFALAPRLEPPSGLSCGLHAGGKTAARGDA